MRDDETGASTWPRREVEREETALVRHEEELDLRTRSVDAGAVRARKGVETRNHSELVPRQVEHFDDVERVAAGENDSGGIETLPDGSVSIPILEEELVVSKRLVVRERVVIRKRTETEQHRVEAELGRERVELDADEGVELADEIDDSESQGGTRWS
jgi:uncharacterized protein (TIGR02271 family)